MSILKASDIKRILKERPNRALVEAGKKMNKKLAVHIAGIGMDTYLDQINTFENVDQKAIRQKYARSNVDLFDRLTRPVDEIFSARGGSVYYNLPKEQEVVFRNALSNVEWGYSLRKWMDNIAKVAYYMDPMGLIFIEVGNNEAYPTYKSIASVYDYQLNGRHLDYIIFTTEEKGVYRVIDDAFDALVKWDGESLTKISGKTFPNYFSHVPARIVSDIIQPGTNYFCSPLWTVVELADEFLREGSIKSIYKLLHGFPKYWQITSDCGDCNGTGMIAGSDCPACKGTGTKMRHDVVDNINIPLPQKDDPKVAPDVAGYVTPDIEGWTKMTEELKLLEDTMNHTIWGTHQRDDSPADTATGRFIDVQPVNRRLNKFSEWGEDMESFITDEMGIFYFPTTYKGASVNYSRRYLIESPDMVWEKYAKARASGSPQSALTEMLTDYYYTKYNNNSIELQKHIRLMKLEPFVHQTIMESKNTAPGTLDYTMKLYFTEWQGTLQENSLLFDSLDVLRASLTAYAQKKQALLQPAPETETQLL